jgi:ABC-2 type transport system permease protein
MTDTLVAPAPSTIRPAGVFLAILKRDLVVTGRDPIFLAQVILQPLFLLFVFGKILTDLGFVQHGYASIFFPGVLALTGVLTALQSTALPLVMELSMTMEIEDRLLAPLPNHLVAIEKVVFSAIRGIVAMLLMFPIGLLILGSIPFHASAMPAVIVISVLGCLVGGTLGLVLGTSVPPQKINMMFALILTPMLFTGSVQYPWQELSHLRWFQVITAANPMTYVSEGLRGSLVPGAPHMPTWLCVVVLLVFLGGLARVGLRGFQKRTVT